MPGVLGAVVAVGIRALARGAAPARSAIGHAATRVLHGVQDHARAVSLVTRPAQARRGGGDRRSAPSRCWRRGASCDRPSARATTGHSSRLAACRQATSGEPAGVRDQVDVHAGSRGRSGHAGRKRARRRDRGDHARRPRLGAALRPRTRRRVGASGVPDRRAALGPAGAAAVAGRSRSCPSARPHCHPAAHGGCGSSAATALHVLTGALSALDASRRRSYPVENGSEPLTSSFVPHPSMPPQSSTTMPETSSAQQLGLGDAEVAEPGESPVAAGYRWVGHAYTRLRGSSPAAQRLPEVALGVQSSSAAVGKNAF
jgi:hypothetical protein